MTRDNQAVWKASPNMWPSRYGQSPKWIIIHGTAGGSASGVISEFQDSSTQKSTHYLIDLDGTIYQFVDEDFSSWGNGILDPGHDSWWNANVNPNWQTISIEHLKTDTQNANALTPAQALASFQLVSRICARWNIPARQADNNGGITGHYSMEPINRHDCPGVYPWQGLYSYLNSVHGETNNMLNIGSGIGSEFVDKGSGRWHCNKTNVDLIGGHLGFFRKYGGVFRLPLTNEIRLAQYPNVPLVVYEGAIVAYDPKDKNGKRILDNPPVDDDCYLLHIDSGVGQQIIAKPLIASLSQQISQLSQELQTAKAGDSTALKSQVDALNKQIDAYKNALHLVMTTIQPLAV